MFELLLLFSAGLLGGMLNSIAGGGSFITFPALMFVGVPPVSANATNTFPRALDILAVLMPLKTSCVNIKKNYQNSFLSA